MFIELAAFTVAALIHFGLLIDGYAHQKAGTAESVIALVLVVGLAATWIRPGSTREIGLAAQGFALLGTLVGIFTIAIGVGPRTAPDIVYHIGILVVLGPVWSWPCERGRSFRRRGQEFPAGTETSRSRRRSPATSCAPASAGWPATRRGGTSSDRSCGGASCPASPSRTRASSAS